MKPKRQRKRDRLVVLFLLGGLLFNYPILSLFDREGMVAGIPILYLFIFSAWLLIIVLVAWVIER
ncbi:MAG: hypothetical protein KC423_12905 [Anaerolineales bacterium]|nr:hypothetical protein [Anaerolineales bacterium]